MPSETQKMGDDKQKSETAILASNISKQNDPTVDIFDAVINGLHVSKKLADKAMIEQELKKWLPSVGDRDLNYYVMCIWLTARYVLQSHECTKSEMSTQTAVPVITVKKKSPDTIVSDVRQIKPEFTGNVSALLL